MQLDKLLINLVALELNQKSRHTRFASARRGMWPWLFKTPCDPLGWADQRCLSGMIKNASESVSRHVRATDGDARLADAVRERIERLYEEEARALGYDSIMAMNDWGGYKVVCAATRSVQSRL